MQTSLSFGLWGSIVPAYVGSDALPFPLNMHLGWVRSDALLQPFVGVHGWCKI